MSPSASVGAHSGNAFIHSFISAPPSAAPGPTRLAGNGSVAARLPGGSQRPSGARISARYDLADGADVAFADVRSLLTTLMRTSATHAEFEAVVRPAFNLTECVCPYLSHPHGKAELE